MNRKQILYLFLTILFILLNLSVLFSAFFRTPTTTFTLLGFAFVLGVILYFLMRFHRKEEEYRSSEKSDNKKED